MTISFSFQLPASLSGNNKPSGIRRRSHRTPDHQLRKQIFTGQPRLFPTQIIAQAMNGPFTPADERQPDRGQTGGQIFGERLIVTSSNGNILRDAQAIVETGLVTSESDHVIGTDKLSCPFRNCTVCSYPASLSRPIPSICPIGQGGTRKRSADSPIAAMNSR